MISVVCVVNSVAALRTSAIFTFPTARQSRNQNYHRGTEAQGKWKTEVRSRRVRFPLFPVPYSLFPAFRSVTLCLCDSVVNAVFGCGRFLEV